ncbi:MAG: hypothetical protein QXU18_07635 [Thermoplasmatales archaeon]
MHTLDADGNVVRKDSFENSYDRLREYLSEFFASMTWPPDTFFAGKIDVHPPFRNRF